MDNIIGKGRTAYVELIDGKAVKTFTIRLPKEYIQREFNYAKIASNHTPLAPKAHKLEKMKGKYKITFDYVKGTPMDKTAWSDPTKFEEMAHFLAKVHSELHQVELDFSDKEDFFFKRLKKVRGLKKSKLKQVIEYTRNLEHTNHLCHGDFHPGNIMIDGDKYYVIDWMLGTSANPLSDVCRTYLMLESPMFYGSADQERKEQIKKSLEIVKNAYIEEYCKLNNVTLDDIKKWIVPIATLRLVENIPHEKDWLLKLIDSYL